MEKKTDFLEILLTLRTHLLFFNSAHEFFEAANRFVPSIITMFHKESEIMLEPDDISCNAPPIPSTFKIHKLVRRVKESDAEIVFILI